jgi:hypothetical protein
LRTDAHADLTMIVYILFYALIQPYTVDDCAVQGGGATTSLARVQKILTAARRKLKL